MMNAVVTADNREDYGGKFRLAGTYDTGVVYD